MPQAPVAPFAAIDQSDAQRPFLGRQTAGLDVAQFNDHKNHHIGFDPYRLDHFLLKRAVAEERPITSSARSVVSEPREGVSPMVTSACSRRWCGIKARYSSAPPRMSAALASADRRTSSATTSATQVSGVFVDIGWFALPGRQ